MSGATGHGRRWGLSLRRFPADERPADTTSPARPAGPTASWVALVLLLAGCVPGPDELDDGKLPPTDPHCLAEEPGVFPDTADPEVDYDCDGWPRTEDCDNRNSEIHPQAPEFNNGVDDDCDGDEGLLYGCGQPGSGGQGREGVGLGALAAFLWSARRRASSPDPSTRTSGFPRSLGRDRAE